MELKFAFDTNEQSSSGKIFSYILFCLTFRANPFVIKIGKMSFHKHTNQKNE